jgi:hypothetical protein
LGFLRVDFWTVLVELLVRLLVAFPTAARGFWFLFHGYFTTFRAAFGARAAWPSAPPHGQNVWSQGQKSAQTQGRKRA